MHRGHLLALHKGPIRNLVHTLRFPCPVIISALREDIDHRTIWRTLRLLEEDHEMDMHSSPIGRLTAVTYIPLSGALRPGTATLQDIFV